MDVWSSFSRVSSLEHQKYLLVGDGFCASRSVFPPSRPLRVMGGAPCAPPPCSRLSRKLGDQLHGRDEGFVLQSRGEKTSLRPFPRPVSPRDRLSEASRQVLDGHLSSDRYVELRSARSGCRQRSAAWCRPTRAPLSLSRSTGDGGGDRLTARQSRELVDGGSATTTASRAAASELEASSASCRTTHLSSRPSSSTGDGGCGLTSCQGRRSQSSVHDCYVELRSARSGRRLRSAA